MKRLLSIMLLGASALVWSQEKTNYTEKGQFSLGLRTTTSVFGHDPVPGLGVGGQFRLQILDYINTEWFADYITMDLKEQAPETTHTLAGQLCFILKN
jgi:hypothetical protein